MASVPMMDFSSAGYGGGGVVLPAVAAKFVVTPTGGDDTRAIQAGIAAVAKLRLGADGFRGALLLRGGTFRVGGQLRIVESGIVLRGDGATLLAPGDSRRTLIEVRGSTKGESSERRPAEGNTGGTTGPETPATSKACVRVAVTADRRWFCPAAHAAGYEEKAVVRPAAHAAGYEEKAGVTVRASRRRQRRCSR